MSYSGLDAIDDKDLRPIPASMPPPTRLGVLGGRLGSSWPGFLSSVPENSSGPLDLGIGAAVLGPPGLWDPSPAFTMGCSALFSDADDGAALRGFEGVVTDSGAFGFTKPEINQVHDSPGGKGGSKNEQPWVVDREGHKYCLLCRQWSDPQHLRSKKHTRRVENPEWYLWDTSSDGDGVDAGDVTDPWAGMAVAHARTCLAQACSDEKLPQADIRVTRSVAPVLVSGQESWHGGPPPPPPPPKTQFGDGKLGAVGVASANTSTVNGLGVLSSFFPNLGGGSLGGCSHVGGGCELVGGPIANDGPGIAAAMSAQAQGIGTRKCAYCSAPAIEKTIPGSKSRYCASCWEWWLVKSDADAAAVALGETSSQPPTLPDPFGRWWQ